MNETGIATVFDEIYDSTYHKALTFVTRKCGHVEDIADILQETYAEVYLVLLRKGTGYIGHPEAFVLRVARTKIHRFYAAKEKRVDVVPLEGEDAEGETWDLSDREWNGA
jgi:RNA polymerase sigma-70 factor (ECF subfamily)